MRIFRNVLVTLLVVVLFGISVVGVMIYFPQIWGTTRIHVMGTKLLDAWRPDLFWFWLVLLLMCILALLTTILVVRRKATIELQMGDGRVVILESAIQKYVKTALGDIPDITHQKVSLRKVRNGLEADIQARVRTHENLPDLERRIIRRVRQALTEELGIASVGAVHVVVLDFEVRARGPQPLRPDQPKQSAAGIRPARTQPLAHPTMAPDVADESSPASPQAAPQVQAQPAVVPSPPIIAGAPEPVISQQAFIAPEPAEQLTAAEPSSGVAASPEQDEAPSEQVAGDLVRGQEPIAPEPAGGPSALPDSETQVPKPEEPPVRRGFFGRRRKISETSEDKTAGERPGQTPDGPA